MYWKKVLKAERRKLIEAIELRYKISIKRACQLCSISQSAHYYEPKRRRDDEEIKHALKSMAFEHTRWGFDKMMAKIKSDVAAGIISACIASIAN